MKKFSETARYFRERGQEAQKWAAEAQSPFREEFTRLAAIWFEAAAEADLITGGSKVEQFPAGQQPTFH